MARPLLEKIDAVHYTQMSRFLKVAEEYAARLLLVRYPKNTADKIAEHLVTDYPEHGFVIDAAEAGRLTNKIRMLHGIELRTDLVETASDQEELFFRKMLPYLGHITAVGRLKKE